MRVLLLLALAGCPSNPNMQRLPIGSPCTMSSDCGTGDFFCATEGHPGGYCKFRCHQDSDCPAGSICAGAGMVSPGACHKICASQADCRPGYECKNHVDEMTSADFCDPPEPGTVDGG
jgi:hypothetical protein